MQLHDRFRVADADRVSWGHLVKDWIKGQIPRPETVEQLQAQCRARGIAINVPDYLKGVVFLQTDKSVLSIRLPPKELVECSEENIIDRDAGYPLPSFYERFFSSPAANPDLTREDKIDLHAARIGEYTVNLCM
jgi:hypothetical protein